MVDVPHDAVAIFHCSFHPTRGNVVDWSLKASDDVDLTNVEFSCLPSGLHTIEEDIVYFSRGDHPGLCVFRRRRTEEHGHRGYRLSSLGILLTAPTTSASSSSTSTSTTSQPKPWLHAPSLKLLVQTIYSSLENRDILEPTERDWEPARAWFEQNRLPSLTTTSSESSPNHLTTPITIPTSVPDPSTHLPHILQASSLGPSLLTISRFLLARRRVLILTKPPVEGACVMCWAIGGLCATEGVDAAPSASTSAQLADTEGPRVLGMVTLHDIDRLERSGKASVTQSQGHGRGWIACTTDSVFVDKTRCWDLLVDVTSCDFSALASQAAVGGQSVSSSEGRPKMYVPKGSLDGDMGDRAGKSGKKEGLRFAWSDVKLWTDLARLAPVPGVPIPPSISTHSHTHSHSHASSSSLSSPSSHRPPPGPSSLPLNLVPPSWLDAGRIYEDACILCAGMWYSSSSSWQEEGQGRIRLNGDDSLATPTYDKSKSMSVEHGRRRSPSGDSRADSTAHGSKRVERVFRRMSESSTAVFTSRTWAGKGKLTEEPVEISALDVDGSEEDFETFRANAAASVSRAFAAYHSRLLQRLSLLVEESSVGGGQSNDLGLRTVMLSPRDLASLDLGPLSVIDARWIEWLSDSHPGVVGGGAGESRRGRTVVRVRRARWRDVLGAVFGFS